MQRQIGTAVHRGDANDVDVRLQAAGVVQRLEGLCEATGGRGLLRAVATRLFPQPRQRHFCGRRPLLSRLPHCRSGGNVAGHRGTALHFRGIAKIHA